MLYGGMGYGMVFGSLLGVLLLLGFAYIVWVFANKESGTVKSIGQVIAAVIAILAAIILLYGTIYGGVVGRGAWCGRGGKDYKSGKSGNWMMKKMMKMPEAERQEMMEKMMKEHMK